VGTEVFSLTVGATATISAGTGMAWIWVDASGVINVGHNVTATCSGATCSTATGFPVSNAFPIWAWTATSGAWDSAGGTDLTATYSIDTPITPGNGIMITETAGLRSIAVNPGSLTLDTRTASITDLAPVAGDSGLIMVINPATSIHLTRIYCAVQGSTNVALNLDKRTEGAIGTDSTHHLLGSDLTAISTGANTATFANDSGQCGGTADCAIAAHVPVVMTITSVSGTPTALNCSVDWTVD
jgi:hypothetical protein